MAHVHVNPFLDPAGVISATVNGLKSLTPGDMGNQNFDAGFFEKKAIDTAIAAAIGSAKDTLNEIDVRRFRALSNDILRNVEDSLETGFFETYKIQEYLKWNLASNEDTTKEFRNLCNNITGRMLDLLEKKIRKSLNQSARKLDITSYISQKLKSLNDAGDIFQHPSNIGARDGKQVVYKDVFVACDTCGGNKSKAKKEVQPEKPEEEAVVEKKNPLSASLVIPIETEEDDESEEDEWKHMKFKSSTPSSNDVNVGTWLESAENIEKRGGGFGFKSRKKKKKTKPEEDEEEKRKRKKKTKELIQQDDMTVETHQGGKKHTPAFVYKTPPSTRGKKDNPFLSKPPAEDDMPDVDGTLSADMPKLRPIASSTSAMPALRPLNDKTSLKSKVEDMPALRPLGSSAAKPIERVYPALRPIIEGRHKLTDDKDGVCPKCMKKFKEYVAEHHQNTSGTAIVFVPNKSVMEKLRLASSERGQDIDYDVLVKSHVAIASSPNQRTLTTDNGNRIDLQGDNSFLFKQERTVKTSDTWSADLGLKNKVVFHLHGSLLK